jgi:predicted ATPase
MNEVYDIFLNVDEQKDFEQYFLPNEDSSILILPNFNEINIFVGSNNSGKSWFLRTLMKQQVITGQKNLSKLIAQINELNTIIKRLGIDWQNNPNIYTSGGRPQVVQNTGSLAVQPVEVSLVQIMQNTIKQKFEHSFNSLMLAQQIIDEPADSYFIRRGAGYSISITGNFISDLKYAIEINKEIVDTCGLLELGTKLNYFIPTLRTAHSLFEQQIEHSSTYKKHKENIFADTIIKNYKLDSIAITDFNQKKDSVKDKIQVFLFTGLNLYNQIVNVRNGSKEGRKRFEDFEKFIGKNFFNTETIDIVAKFNIIEKHEGKDDNEIINIVIGNGREDEKEGRNLYELGDGIQALIILMYGIFMAPENTIIFIDEPELNLHPGMQRLFLEQITTNPVLTDKKLRYVIATHSNHLLDLTLAKDNVSIYSFSKEKDDRFVIRNTNAGDNTLLRELGVNNSSVFLANCSLWVEGISDRNYIKAFLIAYCNADPDKPKLMLKEDIDFAFLEYAGSNLLHYEFSEEDSESIKAFALNNRILILADLDGDEKEKHDRYQRLYKLNPENLDYETTGPYREVENLLSNVIWEKTLIEFCNKKKVGADEEAIQKEILEKTQKEENSVEKFQSAYIGEYLKALDIKALNNVYEEDKDGNPKSLKSYYKVSLSEIVLDKTRKEELKWNDFSQNPRVLKLVETIYNFVMKKS